MIINYKNIKLNIKNIAPDKNATTGTVISHAATIFLSIDLSTKHSFFLCSLLWRYSLKNHTQKTQPIAIWVELTGNHNWLASITVRAADKAIQNALTWSSSVISHHTALISFGQNNNNQNDSQVHHKSIIQNGIPTLQEIEEFISES